MMSSAPQCLWILNKNGTLIYHRDFRQTKFTANDRIRLASTLHGISAVAARISPADRGRGGGTRDHLQPSAPGANSCAPPPPAEDKERAVEYQGCVPFNAPPTGTTLNASSSALTQFYGADHQMLAQGRCDSLGHPVPLDRERFFAACWDKDNPSFHRVPTDTFTPPLLRDRLEVPGLHAMTGRLVRHTPASSAISAAGIPISNYDPAAGGGEPREEAVEDEQDAAAQSQTSRTTTGALLEPVPEPQLEIQIPQRVQAENLGAYRREVNRPQSSRRRDARSLQLALQPRGIARVDMERDPDQRW